MKKPHQKICEIRKQLGLTQEELAEKTKLTVRTIQRIESGKSLPRPFTLKAIALGLGISIEDLQQGTSETPVDKTVADIGEDDFHFLQMFTLSCFSYLLIPFVHFLIPRLILSVRADLNKDAQRFAKKLILQQVYWVISLNIAMLLTVAWNLLIKKNNLDLPTVSYLTTLFVMYLVNALLITSVLIRLKRSPLSYL